MSGRADRVLAALRSVDAEAEALAWFELRKLTIRACFERMRTNARAAEARAYVFRLLAARGSWSVQTIANTTRSNAHTVNLALQEPLAPSDEEGVLRRRVRTLESRLESAYQDIRLLEERVAALEARMRAAARDRDYAKAPY